MIIQTIDYNSKNSYFAGFLQQIIEDSSIRGSVVQLDDKIILTLDEKDEDGLKKFSELSTKYLPYSFFIDKINTQVADSELSSSNFISKPYDIGLCAKCLESLSDPSSPNYLDDTLRCTHYKNTPYSYHDNTNFSPHYTQGSTLLLCDSSKVDEFFVMTDDEKRLLFSIEKPTIKVTIKSQEIKDITGRNFIDIQSPYDTRSSLVAINAKDADMGYLFFKSSDTLKVIQVQKNITIIKASRVATPLKDKDSDKVINRFLNILDESPYTDAIGANISTTEISFIVKRADKVKRVLKFDDFKLQDTMKKMKEDETRSKLINNFESKYPTIVSKLKDGDLNLFETICVILDIEQKSFEALSEKSLEFRGNGGLKVDILFTEDGVDFSALLGSLMSFKLAGADDFYVAYSFFEAIADMAINTLNQLKTKFAVPNIIMMGDMFANSVLYSRILSKYSMANPYFSQNIALDG